MLPNFAIFILLHSFVELFLLPYHNCEEVEEASTGRVCLDRSGRASSRGSSSREGSEGSAGALGNQGE